MFKPNFRRIGGRIIEQATTEATNISRRRIPWSSDKIYGPSDGATQILAQEAKDNFVRGLRNNLTTTGKGIYDANTKFIKDRNSGVPFQKAEDIRQTNLAKVNGSYLQTLHNEAFKARSGGAERDIAAAIAGDDAVVKINKKIADAAEKKIEKSQQELEELENKSIALDAKKAVDLKALVRTDAEITAAIQQDVQTTKTGTIYERFEQTQQGMQEDKDFKTKVSLTLVDKYEQAESQRTKNIINDSSPQRHEKLENDFKTVFRSAFSKDSKAPSAIEQADIDEALNHPSVQGALREAQKDVPIDRFERKARTAIVKSAIQDALFTVMSKKMAREEATRRFLKGTEGSFVAHDIVQKIEAANPSTYGATRLAAARASNIHELHNLKAVPESGKDQINDFQEKHALQVTHAPDATHVQQHQDAQKAPADMQAQKVDELNAMDSATFAAATFADVHENRAKPEEITNHQQASTQLDAHYKVRLEQAQQTSETVIGTARRNRDKEILKTSRQHTLELDTISNNGRLSDSEKAEQREKAKDKFNKTIAEIDERCKSAEIDARKKTADLIIERDTAKAELDRIYPLAAVYHKIADIKRLKKDIQATIDKKFENDEQRKNLQSNLESFKFRKLAKETDWYSEREKSWYNYLEQVEKTNTAKTEYAVAHAESEHYKALWDKSKEEFTIIQQRIEANNERVHQLKTSGSSADADTIAAIQTQTQTLTERKTNVLVDIDKYHEDFREHDAISTQKKLALSHEESALATKNARYEKTDQRAKSEDERETKHADRLRDKEKQQEAFQMLRAIQRSNNRAMILSQALGQSSSAINAHAIGGLQAMLAALQR